MDGAEAVAIELQHDSTVETDGSVEEKGGRNTLAVQVIHGQGEPSSPVAKTGSSAKGPRRYSQESGANRKIAFHGSVKNMADDPFSNNKQPSEVGSKHNLESDHNKHAGTTSAMASWLGNGNAPEMSHNGHTPGHTSSDPMVRMKGLMQAAVKGRDMAKRAQGQSDVINKLEDYFKESGSELKIPGMKLHRRTRREQFSQVKTELGPETDMPFLIFHPFAGWRLCWDMFIMFLLLYSFISVPLRLSFEKDVALQNGDDCSNDFTQQPSMFYFDLSVDLCFMTDILLTFRTAYIDEATTKDQDGSDSSEHRLVTDWKSIFLRYARSFFLIDVSSSMPIDLILLDACGSIGGAQKLIRGPIALKIIRLVRVLKLVRITRLRVFLNKVRDVLHIHPGVLRVIRFIFIVLLALHYNACIFFYIGTNFTESVNGYSHSWVKSFEFYTFDSSRGTGGDLQAVKVVDMDVAEQYLVSLYWSTTTMATVGYGDITPVTGPEIAWVIIVLIQAGVAFSYMVGNMASLLSRVNPRQTRHAEQMELWEDFMHREQLPTDLRGRIRAHKNHTFRYPTIRLPDFAREEMSQTLLRDLTAYMYSSVLHSLPMLKGLDERTLTEVALALEPVQVAPNTVIYTEDELADSMYFVCDGTIEMSMLIVPFHQKEEFGLRVVTDIAVGDATVAENLKSLTKKGKLKMRRQQSINMIDWEQGSTAGAMRLPTNWVPRVFKWYIDEKRSGCFFGDGALTSRIPLRKASAVTKTWCTLFRLDRDVLKRIASKSVAMERLYRSMQRTQACRLLRSARAIVYGRRARWSKLGKLFIRVEKAQNLPKMDGLVGLCDPYCTLKLGYPDPEDKKIWKSMVQYNKLNPTWKETFVFPLDVSLSFIQSGNPVVLHLNVFDHDVVGDHDLIGEAQFDLTQLCIDALGNGVTQPVSANKVLMVKREGVMRNVKGFNRKNSTVYIFVQVLPPTEDTHSPNPADSAPDAGTLPLNFQAAAFKSVSEGSKITSASTPVGNRYGSENATSAASVGDAVNGSSFGTLPCQAVSGSYFGQPSSEKLGTCAKDGDGGDGTRDGGGAADVGGGRGSNTRVPLATLEETKLHENEGHDDDDALGASADDFASADLFAALAGNGMDDDISILLTEIASHNGCSLYSYVQKDTAGGHDIASASTELDVSQATHEVGVGDVSSGISRGNKSGWSSAMTALEEDRLAHDKDLGELESKLNTLNDGVDKLAAVIGDIVKVAQSVR